MLLKDFITKTIETVMKEQQVEDITPIHFDIALQPNGDDIEVGVDMSGDSLSRVKFTIAVTPHPMTMSGDVEHKIL